MKVKKILLTLGIIGLGIINFSYGRYEEVGPRFGNSIIGTEFTNVHEQYLELYVDKDINFTSIKGGIEKDIFAVYAYQGNKGSTAYWFYWNTRGELSAYARDWNMGAPRGGKLTYYYVCDDFELPFTSFTGCIEYLYTGADIGVVNDYLSYVNNGDDIIYGQATEGSTVSNGRFTPFIAFNIPEKNKSIVFYFKPGRSLTVWYNLPYDYYEDYGIDNEYSVKYHIEEFPDSLIGESPIIGGNGGSTTGNTHGTPMCSTIQSQINLYGRNYTTSLCWSDGKININGEITNTGYVSIFTAYPTYQDYLSGFELYNNFCDKENPTYDYSECLEALRELPMGRAGVVLIRNAIKSQLPTQKIYQYCYYQLNFTQEQKNGSGVCEFTDEQIYAPGITGELKNKANGSIMDMVVDSIHNLQDATDQFITPNDGTIFDSILPEGVIGRKQAIFDLDIINNTKKLIAKILTIFRNRPIVDGILPPALTSLLLLIILFRMYRK